MLLAEAFVDQRFRGSCYSAAGRLELAQPKSLLVKEVLSRCQECLAAPFDAPAMPRGGVPLDLNCACAGVGSLLDALERIPV